MSVGRKKNFSHRSTGINITMGFTLETLKKLLREKKITLEIFIEQYYPSKVKQKTKTL